MPIYPSHGRRSSIGAPHMDDYPPMVGKLLDFESTVPLMRVRTLPATRAHSVPQSAYLWSVITHERYSMYVKFKNQSTQPHGTFTQASPVPGV